ncbi:MAG: hypothetical protein NWF05_11975 [Candidatus Bathyarchaeota archaeon]|nr:hypothetical protein [Candidatus Bathyarchaeota archaeon]
MVAKKEKRLSRQRLLPAVVLALVFVLATVAFACSSLDPAFSSDGAASDAELNNAGYLKLPSLPTQDNGYSKLCLTSATSRYDTHEEQACFIINATIRNDYSAQDPPPDSFPEHNQMGDTYFILWTTLYAEGKQINATEITNPNAIPVQGSPQYVFGAGQTGTIEIVMATTNQNVDSFTIKLVAIGGIPIP